MSSDVVVVGAGVAGLACARRLARAGRRVTVLERARGVGGRCATRRLESGQPVDHGVAFLHGSEPAFLDAIDEVDAERLEGWPLAVEGRGVPCQPDTYTARDRRVAFRDGVSVFPKHLARDLDVRTGVTVTEVREGAVALADGSVIEARHVVLALALEQARALLPARAELEAARTLLGWLASVPCLAVIAAYERAPEPRFDVLYPDEGALQTVVHDSSKRAAPPLRVLVLQAGVRASEAWLDADPEVWQRALLDEAATRIGSWAAQPTLAIAHRWKHARFPAGAGLGGPLLVPLGADTTFGLAGEAFGPHAGAQGAFLSGESLARRLLELA